MQVPVSTTVVVPGTQQASTLQAPVVPEAQTAPPVVEAKPDLASEKLELFARKEAAIHREKEAIKEERRQMAETAARLKKYEDLETNKPDPIALLMAHGYTYEDATNFVLNNNKNTPEIEIKRLKDDLEKDRSERKAQEMKAKEDSERQHKEAQEQTLTNFKVEIHDFVTENQEAFELTNLYEAHDLVFDVIDQHWKRQIEEGAEKPKVLSTKEAAEMTEKYLEDLVDKTLETKKWASRFEPKLAGKKAPPTPSGKAPTIQTQSSTTITNHMNGNSSPSMLPAKNETDRISRALAALENQ